MPRRTPGPRLFGAALTDPRMLGGVALGLCASCFSTTDLEGLPCSSDASCGPDHVCSFGRCYAEGFDAQAQCGDGVQQQSEFCYPTEASIPVPVMGILRDIAWADFDGNGFTDALTVSDNITVNYNNGDGTFTPGEFQFETTVGDLVEIGFPPDLLPDDFDIAVTPTHIAVADFAGNELPDLLILVEPGDDLPDEGDIVDTLSDPIWLAENLGDGDVVIRPLFQTSDLGEYQVLTTGLRAGDFNGDGLIDALAITEGDEEALMGVQQGWVMLNGGDGELGPLVEVPLGAKGLPTIADFNGDGVDDLATADDMAQTISVVLGPIGPGFPPTPPSRLNADGNAIVLRAADLDGDSDLDLVAGFGEDGFEIWLGDGSGGFEPGSRVVDQGVIDVVAEDLDADGSVDLVTGSPNGLFVHPGYGDGSYGAGFQLNDTAANMLQLLEVNGDGFHDLVAGSPNLVVLHMAQP